MSNTVDRLLDELFDCLSGSGGAGRRALAEAEDHLHESVQDGLASGLTLKQAEQQAVERFGSPAKVAGALKWTHLGVAAYARPAFVGIWMLGAIGAMAVGVSGLIAEMLGRVFGASFVAGDPPGVTYTAARCADFLEYFPHASSCAAAAASHHWGEVVEYRVAAGVLGILALAALIWARRQVLTGPNWSVPGLLVAPALAVLMGAAGGAFGLLSAGQFVLSQTDGVGANLSAALVAIPLAAGSLLWVLRRLRAVDVR